MSLRKNLVGIALNLIAAGIVWDTKGPHAGLVVAGLGFILLIVASLVGKKSKIPATPPMPVLHQENKQEFNPQFNPQFNPKLYIGTLGATTAPARCSQTIGRNSPLTVGTPNLNTWIHGKVASTFGNHGETALDVQVQRFQVAPNKFASSKAIGTIPAHRQDFIPVWLEGYSSVGFFAEKWDLLKAMKTASDARTSMVRTYENYIVPIIARYKDFDENI